MVHDRKLPDTTLNCACVLQVKADAQNARVSSELYRLPRRRLAGAGRAEVVGLVAVVWVAVGARRASNGGVGDLDGKPSSCVAIECRDDVVWCGVSLCSPLCV